jgi:Zn-dependent peptidase ImmA (M78 family)
VGVRPARVLRRSDHDETALRVLQGYSVKTGWKPALPIPIENIVEEYFELYIMYEVIPEDDDEIILGMLSPTDKTIVLNELHLELFDTIIGPYEFTLAHELGHWIYDFSPDQEQLFPDEDRVLCRSSPSSAAERPSLIEVNANKFAASVLLPLDLFRTWLVTTRAQHSITSDQAANLGVSRKALDIRMEEIAQLPKM